MGLLSLSDGRLMLGSRALRWNNNLSTLEPGPTNPSGRQVLKDTVGCSAGDDKQGSKRVEACSAEHPNPLVEAALQNTRSLIASKQQAGARDGGSANLEATSAGSQFVKGLELVLTHMAQAAQVTSSQLSKKAKPFHSAQTPSMSIQDYLNRIRKYFRCRDECFVLALVYIDRVAKADSGMAVSALNAHRLLLIAVVLSAKFQDDIHYCNAYYAKVGGLALQEVNLLEKNFVTILSWELYVGPEEYQFYHNVVCEATSAQVQMRSLSRTYKEPEATVCRQCGHVKTACDCESQTTRTSI